MKKTAFEELKQSAITYWFSQYDNDYKYASDKVSRIQDLKPSEENANYIIQMFDTQNQFGLKKMMQESGASKEAIEIVNKFIMTTYASSTTFIGGSAGSNGNIGIGYSSGTAGKNLPFYPNGNTGGTSI